MLHEEPEEFTRIGAAIGRCPACPTHKEPILSREKRLGYAAVAELLGDDIDGVVALAEDFGLWD